MRSVVLDELRPAQMDRLREYLQARCLASGLSGVYWLELPPEVLNDIQAAHKNCAPFKAALVLEQDSLRCELLLRGHNSLRCQCTGYAGRDQRDYLLSFLDQMIADLNLET